MEELKDEFEEKNGEKQKKAKRMYEEEGEGGGEGMK